MSWEEYGRKDILDWLLSPDEPGVRFWALQQLLDRAPDDGEVLEAQEEVMGSSCVRRILSALSSEGYWENPEDIYLPKYTAGTHNLLILAELGARRTPEIEKSLEHVFQFQRDSGHFLKDLPKTAKGKASVVKDGCCYDGNILYYLIHFGYLDDPRTQRLIDFQIDYYSQEEGGWKCRAFPIDPRKVFPKNCFMGRVKVLKALAKIPTAKRKKPINAILQREAEEILENGVYKYLRNPDGSRKEKAGWKRFGFPLFYQSDVLEVLDVLTEIGVKDPRMKESIDLTIGLRDANGRWHLKDTFNGKMMCEIEAKNEPSKWITLRALRVLKRYLG
jgi:hypothetical protein